MNKIAKADIGKEVDKCGYTGYNGLGKGYIV